MPTSTKQQALFFRLLFKIKTRQELQDFYDFLKEQHSIEPNHKQFVNKTKLFVDFLEKNPKYELDCDLGIQRGCNLWNYCDDFPNKGIHELEPIVVNIYKYADSISGNIYNLSVLDKDVFDSIIQILKKRFPGEPTENNIVENMKTIKHRRELELFIYFFDEIIKSKEIHEDNHYLMIGKVIGKLHNILYDINNDAWNKLKEMEDHIKEMEGCYRVLNTECPEINQFFDV